ncbi:hypothetical protein MBT84_03030 [Streptomyces sp. MBT84]|nr:hypothetical protein [Streptomyces sp. MBT84]
MHHGRIAVSGPALVAALGPAGCGGGSTGNEDGAKSQAPAAAMNPSAVRTNDSPLGTVLVDGGGRTLYLFTADGKNTNSMDCDAACLKLWPPMEGKPKPVTVSTRA